MTFNPYQNNENRFVGTGFGRPGFGRPGFGRPGFGRPGFGRPPFGRPGFGRPFGPPFGTLPFLGGLIAGTLLRPPVVTPVPPFQVYPVPVYPPFPFY